MSEITDVTVIKNFNGKTIAKVEFGRNDLGDTMFRITFTDGTKLVVEDYVNHTIVKATREDKA